MAYSICVEDIMHIKRTTNKSVVIVIVYQKIIRLRETVLVPEHVQSQRRYEVTHTTGTKLVGHKEMTVRNTLLCCLFTVSEGVKETARYVLYVCLPTVPTEQDYNRRATLCEEIRSKSIALVMQFSSQGEWFCTHTGLSLG